MAKQKGKDTVSGAAQGAAAGTAILPGWGTAIGAGVGGLGGYLGLMPGTGQDDGQEAEKKRLQGIDQSRGMIDYMQQIGAQQRRANIQDLGQMYQPVNDRLARLYGSGARVQMPTRPTPIEQLHMPQPAPVAPPVPPTPQGRPQ